jgi:hypothetical protein
MKAIDAPIVFSFPIRRHSLTRDRRLSRGKAGYKESYPCLDDYMRDMEDVFTFKFQNSPPG